MAHGEGKEDAPVFVSIFTEGFREPGRDYR